MSDIRHVVDPVGDVERVERHCDSGSFLLPFFEQEIMRPAEAQFRKARALQGISRHSRRTGVRVAVVIVGAAGRFSEGGSGVCEDPMTEVQLPRGVNKATKIYPNPLPKT